MYFRREIIESHRGDKAEVYFAKGVEAQPLPSPFERTMRCNVGGRPYSLSSRVIDMLLKFNRSLEERSRLGHDCAIFAVACMTGKSLEGVDFAARAARVRSSSVNVMAMGADATYPPRLQPGEVLFTSRLALGDPDMLTRRGGIHYMVPATPPEVTKEGDTLYASKPGKDGEVILHSYTGILRYQDVHTVGIVSGMRVEYLGAPGRRS